MSRLSQLPRMTALAAAIVLLTTALLLALIPALVFLSNTEDVTSTNSAAIRALKREAAMREHGDCLLFERQHKTNIERLLSTYDYLETVPQSQAGTPLVRAVLRGLPAQEAAAREASPPEHCDAPGVGLEETSAAVPPRQDFSHLAGGRPATAR